MRNNSEIFDRYNQAPQRELRLVVVIEFPTPVYLASHGDIPNLPAGALAGVLQKTSSTSQRLVPEQGRAEIGAISFDVVDVGGVVSDTLHNQLALGHGIKGRTVGLYQGGKGMDWSDFRLEQTQIADESLSFDFGRYSVRCRDIQRAMRKDIFTPRSTKLAAAFPKGADTLQVYSTAEFEPCTHTASFGDAPGQTVYYLKIKYQNGWEVVRATGKTASSFTGVTRGLFGTVEYDHTLPSESDGDKGVEVEEFIYLELPAPAFVYALLTGKILGTSDVLPSNWHLGIDPAYVVADEFENIGADWYQPGDYSKGEILRFDGLQKTDGKRFIEQEINLLLGAYMPVNAAGQLGYRRMAGVLAEAGSVGTITAADVVSAGPLTQDLAALQNLFSIQWAWYEAPGFDGRFLRANVLADAVSVAMHGEAKTRALKFKGLHNSRHTFTTLKNRFDALRDRFAGPPLRLRLTLKPSKNDIEVGDVLRVTLPQVRDYTAGGTLDRAMEVQRISVDQTGGGVQVELFGSTQAAQAINDEDAAPNAELPDGWYSSAGTEMTAAGLTIDGSGFLTADGTLNGAASSRTIFYYLGDLTIPAGRTLTVTQNVELRVMGVLQVDGTLRGAPSNGGVGFVGSCRGGNGKLVGKYGPGLLVNATRGEVVRGRNEILPALTIDNDGGVLTGIPDDLRGSGGADGGNSYYFLKGDNSYEPTGFGGNGGNGGAGLVVVARGVALGVSGKIDSSGGAGSPGTRTTAVIANGPYGGSGGGGAPGGVLLVIDGHQNPQPVLTGSKLVACYGDSPDSPGLPGLGGQCLGAAAARVLTVPKSRSPYPVYTKDPEIDPAILELLAEAEIPNGALLTSGDLQFFANRSSQSQNPNSALGEVGLTAGFIIDASGTRRDKVAVTVNTPFEGSHPYRGYFYIVWSDEIPDTRFNTDFGENNYFVATYDAASDQWTAWPNVGNSVDYTPLGTDLLLAVGARGGDSPGLTSVKSLLRPTGGLLYYAGGGAFVGDLNASFNEDGGNLVQDPHFDAVVAGSGPAPFNPGAGVSYGNFGEGGSPALGITATATPGEVIYSTLQKNSQLVVYPARAGDAFIVRARVFRSAGHASDMYLMLDERDSATDYGTATGGYPRFFEASGLVDGWNDVTGIAKVQQAATRGVVFAFYCDGGAKVAGDNLVIDFIQLTPLLAGWETLPESGATYGATAAQAADINAAQFELSNIGADGILHPTEKKDAQARYNEIWGRRASVQYQADTFGLGALRSTYDAASSALDSYLAGLSPAWDDKSQSTSISRTVWDANWQAVLDAERDILDAISGLTEAGINPLANLLRNPTGQKGLTYWSSSVAGVTAANNEQYGEGWVFRTPSANNPGAFQIYLQSQSIPMVAGIPLNLSADIYAGDVSAGSYYLEVVFLDGSSNPLGYSSPILGTNGSGWERKSVAMTTPTGCVSVAVRVGGTPTIVTAGGQVKRIMLCGGSVARPFVDTLGSERDLRNMPMVAAQQSSLPVNPSYLTAADAGASATVTIATHTMAFGDFEISYGSGSVSGLSFSTKYYIYCNDPDQKGGSVAYYATTSLTTLAQANGRRGVGTITTPADGGSSTVPEDPYCVDYDTVLPDGRYLRTLQPGDLAECIDVRTGARGWFPLRAMGEGVEDCYALQTPEGAEVWQSESTPMDLPDGAIEYTPQMLGKPVYILQDGVARLSAVSGLQPLGRRRVLKPDFGDRMFFAGRVAALAIATHNIRYKY